MKPILLFVHGWGFDASLWNAVRACFANDDSLAWDLGFFGAPARPAPPPGRPVIAIGHSFGALWLAHQRPLPWAAFVAINGFTCFARRDDFPAGVAQPVLTRMRRRLHSDAGSVVAEFRATCGSTAATPAPLDLGALDMGLAALGAWDARPLIPDLALCAERDSISAPAMSSSCFSNIVWHPGGHLLPLEDPAWCAGQLEKLLA